jgi:hypothetical protein
MKKVFLFGLLALALAVLAGCAAGPNSLANRPREGEEIAGFWQGLWHGIIAPITFVVSLFNSNVSMYEVHNNGNWYNFGFLLGIGATWGGSGGAASRKRRWNEFRATEV